MTESLGLTIRSIEKLIKYFMKTYVYQNVLVIVAYANSKIWENGLGTLTLQDKIVKNNKIHCSPILKIIRRRVKLK